MTRTPEAVAPRADLSAKEEPRIMAEKSSDLPVRIIGSRELHQNLPTILRELERNDVRYVLTVHGKPRAVLVGAEPYMNLVLDRKSPSEALVGLQLSALLGETLNAASLEDLEKALDPKSE
jgi:prevent-host-death family protein